MADSEDPADAAVRLEHALERIAQLARRPASATDSADTARVALRLDALIAHLRAALGAPAGS